MGEKTEIAWTDATFNPWWGCAKVSPACDNCYAERDSKRFGHKGLWGPNSDRRFFGDKHWNEPMRWNDAAAREGRRMRVFCASMADVFDNHDEVYGARERLWKLIAATPWLDWLLLTKRIGNVPKMLPADWGQAFIPGYSNVWLGISVVNQEEADRDIPKLLQVPARIRFLSCEPLLEAIDLRHWIGDREVDTIARRRAGLDYQRQFLHWVIVGGESGPRARPMAQEWCTDILKDCNESGVAFFMKQGSEADWGPQFRSLEAFPKALQVREWPTP